MSAALRCLTCRTVFAPFGGAEQAVANFHAHRCSNQRIERQHPSNPDWQPDGAA